MSCVDKRQTANNYLLLIDFDCTKTFAISESIQMSKSFFSAISKCLLSRVAVTKSEKALPILVYAMLHRN